LSDSSIGSGVRRLEALTGAGAERWIAERIAYLDNATRLLNTTAADLEAKILNLQSELDAERRKRAEEERRRGQAAAGDLAQQAVDVDGAKMLVARVDVTTPDALGPMGDTLKQRLGSSVIVLGTVVNDRPSFVATVTPDLTKRVHAGNLIRDVAKAAGGGGGGQPHFAKAGGKDASQVDAALDLARRMVKEALSGSG
jgi:alanyl-tRNA synthetase